MANKKIQKPVVPTSARVSEPQVGKAQDNRPPLLFGRANYVWMVAGIVLVAIGMMLMIGGAQPDHEWNPSEIYSFRRTAIAPFVILLGLGIEIFAIFKKTPQQ